MEPLTPEDVYRTDLNARYLGIQTSKLMENAGKAVAEEIQRRTEKGNVVVVAGKGNNGGDGFVTARHLHAMGYKVQIVLLARESLVSSKEAQENLQIAKKLRNIDLIEIKDSTEITKLSSLLEDVGVIVDGILGVGIKGPARGLPAKAIKTINQFAEKAKIFSIDVPSGLDVSTGEAKGVIVNADVTVTFSALKKGLTKQKGGEIIVKSIGIPPEARNYVGLGDLLVNLKGRDPWTHKGDFGNVLIIGGSKQFSGAPALSALSCLKSGADLAIIAAPESVSPVIRGFSPDIILKPLSGANFNKKAAVNLTSELEKSDTVILGPGIGKSEEIFEAVKWVADKTAEKDVSLVVDADALKALGTLGIPQGEVVVTPHAGEFEIMFNEEPPRNLKKRGKTVKKYANRHDVTILLKGHVDVISDGQVVKFNDTGNPGMTVGGTGDVLSGIVGALLAQGMSPFEAAACGAFISGSAGDRAFEKHGYGLTASDVIEQIPEVFKWAREVA